MHKLTVIAIFLSVLSSLSHAANIELGEKIKPLVIEDRGEILQTKDNFEFLPWNSDVLSGKVHILHYMSATLTARSINKAFTEATKTLEAYGDNYLVTTILNLDDAFWGTSGFVISELKKNKKKYPYASLVADKEASGRKHWDLKKDNSTIAVLNKEGKVIFFKEGALTKDEVDSTMKLILENM